jgi:hypothetical protein
MFIKLFLVFFQVKGKLGIIRECSEQFGNNKKIIACQISQNKA